MSKFVMPITTAVLLFPLIAALITAPFLIYKYRKVGSVPWLHAAAMYSFVFYLMCAYFLVLLPLPADRTAVVAYAQTPQLIPFQFVRSFLAETTARLDDPSTWLAAICDPYMYEAFFNVLLLVPLGAYLRYYFHRPWWQTLLIGFCVTLSFETTQLTGIWGIYEHPYRLFDVDDLMTNTLGCMVGFWLARPVMRVLPDVRVAARQAAERGTTASATRRALTFGLDLALSQALAGCGYFAVHAVNGSRLLAGFGIEHATFWTCECAAIAAVFALFPVITRGQTPAQKLLRLRIVRPDAAPASGGQIVCRYATLFAIVLLPAWAFGLVAGVDDILTTPAELRALASLCVHDKTALTLIWCAGVLAWAATLAVRAWRAWRGRAPFIMLNGLISDTRIMTEDGIKQIRERTHVLDVGKVVELEQRIAACGTSLGALMERAGCAIADQMRSWVPDPAPILILTGSGNNGGDGWVCGRALAQAGWPVALACPRPPEQLSAEPARTAALEAVTAAEAHGWPFFVLVAPTPEELSREFDRASGVVDAILGTGFSGMQVREPYATWIQLANRRRFRGKLTRKRIAGARHPQAGKRTPAHAKAAGKAKDAPFTIAADVPSGVSAQTGDAALPRIYADETVTMIVYKPGLLARKAAPMTGVVRLAPLVDDVERYLDATRQTGEAGQAAGTQSNG